MLRMRTRDPAQSSTKPLPPAAVLLRGLSILEALNQRPVSSVVHIAHATGLPKPTVVRMLGQLMAAAYVQRLPKRRGYMLGERVQGLSAGYRSADAVAQIGRPVLREFTARHKWPVSLATLDVDAMRVRATSLHESPFSTPGDQRRIARRVPMLASAHGRAYLAFCPDDERDIILALLRASAREVDAPARDPRHLASILETAQRAGYAVSAPLTGDPAIGLAVPVMVGPRVVASLSLRYLGKAISEREVARRYLSALRDAAHSIASALSASTA